MYFPNYLMYLSILKIYWPSLRMQRQTDHQDDENFGNCNLSKSIRKVSRFKVYDAKTIFIKFS